MQIRDLPLAVRSLTGSLRAADPNGKCSLKSNLTTTLKLAFKYCINLVMWSVIITQEGNSTDYEQQSYLGHVCCIKIEQPVVAKGFPIKNKRFNP